MAQQKISGIYDPDNIFGPKVLIERPETRSDEEPSRGDVLLVGIAAKRGSVNI